MHFWHIHALLRKIKCVLVVRVASKLTKCSKNLLIRKRFLRISLLSLLAGFSSLVTICHWMYLLSLENIPFSKMLEEGSLSPVLRLSETHLMFKVLRFRENSALGFL